MKKFGLMVLFLSMICSLCGCIDYSDQRDPVISKSTATADFNKNSQTSVVSTETFSADTESDVTDVSTETTTEIEDDLAMVGESVVTGKWRVSLLSAKTYDKLVGTYHTDEPANGKLYLVLFFEVENVSLEDSYFNSMNVEAYEDGYGTDLTGYLWNDPEGWDLLTGDVASGKKLKGYYAFEVDSDWREFELYYKESGVSSNGKKLRFYVTPAQVGQ